VPRYCFKTPSGAIIERERPIQIGPPKFIMVDGRRANRCLQAELAAPVGTKKVWRRRNVALGVNPKQIPRLQRLLKARGAGDTQFDKRTGDCMVENRTHYNQIMKARGMFNQDAGYGDWAGKN